MRVALLQADVPPAAPGGVGYQVSLLADSLARRGHDVTLFCTCEPPALTAYRCVRVPLAHGGRLYRQIGVGLAFSRLDLSKFDIIHAHGDDWLFGKRPRVRTFYGTALMEARMATSWGRRMSQLGYYPMELLSSLGATSVTISEATRRFLPLVERCIPAAYDPSFYFPGDERTPNPSILFVSGTLKGRKRGALLLDTFASVRRSVPEATLTIISSESVCMPGVTSVAGLDPAALGAQYRSHWVLCSTSSYEGFGVPYVEAMASGLPVITTSNAGAREILEDGRLGVICSPDELPGRLRELLTDDSHRMRLAQKGVPAAARYSIHLVVDEYERLYNSVLAGAGRR